MQNNNHSNIMKPQKRGKKTAIVVIIVIIIGFVAGAYFIINSRSNQKDSLNNPKAFKEAQDSFNNFPGVSKLLPSDREKLKKDIEPQYLAGYVTGFGPNQNEIETAKSSIGEYAGPATIKGYIQNIIDKKIELAKNSSYYQGYLYYFWFGYTVSNKYPGEEVKNWGDAGVLAQDRKYAEDKANESRLQLLNSKITPESLSNNLNSDPRLKLYDQANNSGYFSKPLPLSNDQNYYESISKLFSEVNAGQKDSINKLLSTINGSGPTQIGLIVADPGLPSSGSKKEVGFVMAYIDVYLKGQKSIDIYNNQLKIARSKIR